MAQQKRLTIDEQLARLAEQAHTAQVAADAKQKRVNTLLAKARKLEKDQARDRQAKWGKRLDDLGLLTLDDAALDAILLQAVQLATNAPTPTSEIPPAEMPVPPTPTPTKTAAA